MVSIEHLHKSIRQTPILRDISLSIAQGEVVGLLGPNGAGKTTLMKVLTGLWKADSGKVEVAGVDVPANPDAVHAHIGYLPEQNPLYPDMYVREYLLFIDRLRKAHTDIEALIRRVGLSPEAHKHIRELSKGYRQRVGLAAAMIGDPEVLILDEPTTGLDPNQLVEIRSLIKDLGKKHTIILSTHILQEVQAMCSRVIIIAHGTLKYDAPISSITNLEELFAQQTTPPSHGQQL